MLIKEGHCPVDMELSGTVSSGLGRAHVFMAQPHYQDQFRTVLGNTAWPGTLNIQIDDALFSHYIALRQKAGIDTLDAPEEARAHAKTLDVETTSASGFVGFCETGSRSVVLQPSKGLFTTANKALNAPC